MLAVESGVFFEYHRVLIQLGYVVLFAPAFPILALVSYASFLVELRSDAYKLLANSQRPRYRCAQDIGSWQRVLEALSVICIITNVGLIGYTSTSFSAPACCSVRSICSSHHSPINICSLSAPSEPIIFPCFSSF